MSSSCKGSKKYRKSRSKYYYVYRSAANGEFINELKFWRSDPDTVYKERRLRHP